MLKIKAPENSEVFGTLEIPASKSISNRCLIIQALCEESIELENLSISDDTKVLQEALNKVKLSNKNENTNNPKQDPTTHRKHNTNDNKDHENNKHTTMYSTNKPSTNNKDTDHTKKDRRKENSTNNQRDPSKTNRVIRILLII